MFNALLSATAALALQQAAPVSDEVVVTGRKPMEQSQAQKAVNAVTVTHESQIARFQDPVCPLVVGLPMEARQVVEEEIRTVARNAGARIGGVSCDANLILILAGDRKAMFSDIRKRRPDWLEGMSSREIEKILEQPAPVLAWAVRTVRDEDGRILKVAGDRAGKTEGQTRTHSIIQQSTSMGIQGAVMIVDKAAVDGRSLGEVGQYAAMRGLAVTRVPEGDGFGTILGLFNSSQAPRELTRFDRDYLAALYAGNGRDLAVNERSRIARAIAAPRR